MSKAILIAHLFQWKSYLMSKKSIKKIYLDAEVLQFHSTGVSKVTENLFNSLLLNENFQIIALYRGLLKGALNKKIKKKSFSKYIPNIVWRNIVLPIFLNLQEKSIICFPWNGNIPYFLKKSHKVVTIIYDVLPLEIPEYFQNFDARNKYNKDVQCTIEKTDLLLTISEYSKTQLTVNFKISSDLLVISLGNTLPVINESEITIQEHKTDYLYVGGYDKRKGLVQLLNVFSNLKNQGLLPGKLILTGKVNYFSEEFQNLVETNINLGYVVEKGYVSDYELSDLYKNSKGLVYPSKYEGFGLPPLEAMNHGCPVLTTPYCSIPEVCGQAALYFNPDNYDEFREVFLNFERDINLQKKMINLGYLQAKKFSWGNLLDLLIDIPSEAKV